MTCPRDDTRRRTVTHGEDAPSSYGAESQTATTPVAVESRVSTGACCQAQIWAHLSVRLAIHKAVVWRRNRSCLSNSMHNSIIEYSSFDAVINPVAQIQLYCAAPLLTPPRPPLAPLPHLMAHRRAPQLPQRSTWLYLAAARLRPQASHTSGLPQASRVRARLEHTHWPVGIVGPRPRLFSSDARAYFLPTRAAHSISWKVRRLYSGFLPGAPGGLPLGRLPLILSCGR